MSELSWSIVSLVLFLVALPLLSFGTDAGQPVVWWIGLVLLTVAGLIPPALRYIPLGQGDG